MTGLFRSGGSLGMCLVLLLMPAAAHAGYRAERYVPRKLFGLLEVAGVAVELLEDQGADDHWHRSWAVTGMANAYHLLREAEVSLDNPFVPAPAPWQKMEVAQRDDGPPTSAWFLTDERGQYWEGLVRVRPDPADSDRWLVSVDIERGHTGPHGVAPTGPPDPRLRLGQARVGQRPPAGLDLSRERLSQNGRFRVRFEPQPGRVPARLEHAWTLWVYAADGEGIGEAIIETGGGRPQTGEALPGSPTVRRDVGTGAYLVEGLRFPDGDDPPTWWEVRFLIRAGVAEDIVIFNLLVPEPAPLPS